MINFRELISCSNEHCFEFVWFGPRPIIEIIKWTLIACPKRQRRQFCAKTTVLYIAIGNKPEFRHFVFPMCLTRPRAQTMPGWFFFLTAEALYWESRA